MSVLFVTARSSIPGSGKAQRKHEHAPKGTDLVRAVLGTGLLTLLILLSKITQHNEWCGGPDVRAEPGRHSRGQAGEPRRFLQVVAGARQVGKTTLVAQALAPSRRPEPRRLRRRADDWRHQLARRPVGPARIAAADAGAAGRGAGPRRGAEDPRLVRDREAPLGRRHARPASPQGGRCSARRRSSCSRASPRAWPAASKSSTCRIGRMPKCEAAFGCLARAVPLLRRVSWRRTAHSRSAALATLHARLR